MNRLKPNSARTSCRLLAVRIFENTSIFLAQVQRKLQCPISSLWFKQKFFVFFHLHCKRESCATVFSLGIHFYRATILDYQVLANHQSHSNSFAVHFGCPQKFSKKLEQAIDVLRKYTLACVNDVHFQRILFFVKGHDHANHTTSTKLESVLYQVDQNLLESYLVAD